VNGQGAGPSKRQIKARARLQRVDFACRDGLGKFLFHPHFPIPQKALALPKSGLPRPRVQVIHQATVRSCLGSVWHTWRTKGRPSFLENNRTQFIVKLANQSKRSGRSGSGAQVIAKMFSEIVRRVASEGGGRHHNNLNLKSF